MTRKKDYDYIQNTKSGIWVQGKEGFYQVSSFGLKILYRIQSSYGEISWVLTAQTVVGDTMISVTNKEFSSAAAFHEVLLSHGFVFRGEKAALNAIKEALVPEAEQAEAVASLGHRAGSGLFF